MTADEGASSPAGVGVLTLNVSRPPLDRAKALLKWLIDRDEEIFVLTEMARSAGSEWLAQMFRDAGCAVIGLGPEVTGLGVVVISRGVDIEPDTAAPESPVPGRIEPFRVEIGGSVVRAAGVYGVASDPVRYSSSAQRQRKREWLTAYDEWLGRWLARELSPAVVIGDLNIVDPIHAGSLRYVLPEETACYREHVESHGLVDAWRAGHRDRIEVSWVDHSGVGCRYDHLFATERDGLDVQQCVLVAEPRELSLTDHSALVACLELH